MAAISSGPAPDRAPDWVATGTPEPLRAALVAALGADRVLTRALDLVRYASDASPYRLIPQAVVAPRDVGDMSTLLRTATDLGVPVTFRAGGRLRVPNWMSRPLTKNVAQSMARHGRT